MSRILRFPHAGAWSSMSGIPLNGSKVVRLVYMDETGIGKIEHEPWLIVAGVIVDADRQLLEIERRIAALVGKHIPAQFHTGFVFHAKELFNGGKDVFKRNDPEWPMERRFEVAADLAKIPQELGLPIALGQVERREFRNEFVPQDWGSYTQNAAAHSIAFTVCSAHVELWMRKRTIDEVCILIVEDNEEMRTKLRNVHRTHQNPNVAVLTKVEGDILPFRKIKHSPLFEPKDQSPPLQIADFCAYVTKKAAVKDMRFRDLWKTLEPLLIQMDYPEGPAISDAQSA